MSGFLLFSILKYSPQGERLMDYATFITLV